MSVRGLLASVLLALGFAREWPSVLGRDIDEASPTAPPERVSIVVERGSLADYFLLEFPSAEGARWIRAGFMVFERSQKDGLQTLALDLHFVDGNLTIHQVETSSAALRQLVWREYGQIALRTWIAEQVPGCGQLEITSWGLGEPAERSLQSASPVSFPLECIENLRLAKVAGEVTRLSALAGGLEVVSVQSLELDPISLPPAWADYLMSGLAVEPRAYRLVRADGSLAEALLFDREVLVALELQPGGVTARRIEVEDEGSLAREFQTDAGLPNRWQQLRDWSSLRRVVR
jgi:hypothetical protein